MLFASLEGISGVSDIAVGSSDLDAALALRFGPLVYDFVLLATCLTNILIYGRLSASIAEMSLKLDPTDTPYRPFKLTDTLFGYLLIVFFTTIAVHLTAYGHVGSNPATIWIIDGAAALLGLLFYPLRMFRELNKHRRK
jgi:hypothetical protein